MRHLSLSSIALSMALVLGLPATAAASGATPPPRPGRLMRRPSAAP